MEQSKVGRKKKGLKVNRQFSFENVTDVSFGCTKKPIDPDYSEHTIHFSTGTDIHQLVLSKKDFERMMWFFTSK